jgi:hypothetical protein
MAHEHGENDALSRTERRRLGQILGFTELMTALMVAATIFHRNRDLAHCQYRQLDLSGFGATLSGRRVGAPGYLEAQRTARDDRIS